MSQPILVLGLEIVLLDLVLQLDIFRYTCRYRYFLIFLVLCEKYFKSKSSTNLWRKWGGRGVHIINLMIATWSYKYYVCCLMFRSVCYTLCQRPASWRQVEEKVSRGGVKHHKLIRLLKIVLFYTSARNAVKCMEIGNKTILRFVHTWNSKYLIVTETD